MALEILSAQPHYTVAVDVWAVGVMYHEMLFGTHPFKAQQMFQLAALLKKQGYQVPKGAKIS